MAKNRERRRARGTPVLQQPQITTNPSSYSSSLKLHRKIRFSPNAQAISNRRASLRSASKGIEILCASPVASSNQESEHESSSSPHPNAEIDNFLQSGIPNVSTSRPANDGENIEAFNIARVEETVAKAPPTEAVSNAQNYPLEQSINGHGSREDHSDLPPSVPTPIAYKVVETEQVLEGDGIVASNIGGERHEDHASNSTVGRVGRSLSLNLSEMANMWQDSASSDPEVGFLSSSLVTVNGYRVKEASASILRAIIGKHGDIAMSCTLARVETRSCLLDIVCDIIRTLQEEDFKDITPDNVRNLLAVVADLRDVKLNVDWLYRRLDDILEAKKMVQDCFTLKEAKSRQIQVIEEAKRELEGYYAEKLTLEHKISLTKEMLTSAEIEINKINRIAQEAKPKVMAYFEGSMVDGLL